MISRKDVHNLSTQGELVYCSELLFMKLNQQHRAPLSITLSITVFVNNNTNVQNMCTWIISIHNTHFQCCLITVLLNDRHAHSTCTNNFPLGQGDGQSILSSYNIVYMYFTLWVISQLPKWNQTSSQISIPFHSELNHTHWIHCEHPIRFDKFLCVFCTAWTKPYWIHV